MRPFALLEVNALPIVFRMTIMGWWLFSVGLALKSAADEQDTNSLVRSKSASGYRLDYPVTERWCPPIRSAFHDAATDFHIVRGRVVRHKPRGGYGLPVVDQVGGKNLLHLGADLGWHQIGEPVFAVANGIVRVSEGPAPEADRDGSSTKKRGGSEAKNAGPLPWGNFIAIEHQLPATDDQPRYVTTLYGHLGTDRRVEVGDLVRAGQRIGSIGAKRPHINGGYDPHLHFGVREGRAATVGATLLFLMIEGKRQTLRIVWLEPDYIQVELPPGLPPNLVLGIGGERFAFESRERGVAVTSRILAYADWPEFPLVGYGLSLEGWHDPTTFLQQMRADRDPAPFVP